MILDASAVLELILGTPTGADLARAILSQGAALHAPEVLDLEVAQGLRRFVRLKEVTRARADAAFVDLCDLALTRHSHAPLMQRIWNLRGNVSAYDAAYVSLAEALDRPLVTRDKRLARFARRHVQVELLR